VVGVVAAWLAIKIFRHSEGSVGTITRYTIAHARIYLVGKPGIPDILIARIPTEGTMVGGEIAAVLSLPFEDKHVVV
jgi:hypothetical protein